MSESPAPHFERIALIGIGLIGSSLARLVRRDGLADHIAVCARTHATLDKARALGSPIRRRPTLAPASMAPICRALHAPGHLCGDRPRHRTGLAAGAIVTDVGSAKECVIVDVGPHLPEGVHFVPGHPIAGTAGPEAGFAELFEGRFCSCRPAPIRRRSSRSPHSGGTPA